MTLADKVKQAWATYAIAARGLPPSEVNAELSMIPSNATEQQLRALAQKSEESGAIPPGVFMSMVDAAVKDEARTRWTLIGLGTAATVGLVLLLRRGRGSK